VQDDTIYPPHLHIIPINLNPTRKDKTANGADEVREFEAKRGVNDLDTQERASRSKDRGRRRSDIVPEEDTDNDGGDEPDMRVKGNVSRQVMLWDVGWC
jgi:hypothetical protein